MEGLGVIGILVALLWLAVPFILMSIRSGLTRHELILKEMLEELRAASKRPPA